MEEADRWVDCNGNVMVELGVEDHMITHDQLETDDGEGHFIMDGKVFGVEVIKDGGR